MTRWLQGAILIGLLALGGVGFLPPPVVATVSEVTARDDYTAAGGTDFTFNFRVTDEDHIAVYVDGTLKTLTTDYTVSGVGDATGTVSFVTAPASGVQVTLLRAQPLEQPSDYILNEGFPSERVEQDLDELTMSMQMQAERQNRTLHVPTISTLDWADLQIPISGCDDDYLKWNATTTGFECATLTSSGTLADPVPAANGGTGLDNTTASVYSGLPAAGTAGRLARVTDDSVKPFYLDDGSNWLPFLLLDSNEDLPWESGTAFTGTLRHANTAARIWDFPDESGTVALTDGACSVAAFQRASPGYCVRATNSLSTATTVTAADSCKAIDLAATNGLDSSVQRVELSTVIVVNDGTSDGDVQVSLTYYSDSGCTAQLIGMVGFAPTLVGYINDPSGSGDPYFRQQTATVLNIDGATTIYGKVVETSLPTSATATATATGITAYYDWE